MGGDSTLTTVTHILVDEVHEQNCFSDSLLIALRDSLAKFRSLHLILMSATVNCLVIVAAIVVCSESIQMYVDCTAHTHNTSDSSENTSKSIHFLITPNETAIITDVMFENIILQWIILKCVRR